MYGPKVLNNLYQLHLINLSQDLSLVYTKGTIALFFKEIL